MKKTELERLIVVEQKQKEMTVNLAKITKVLDTNTNVTLKIQKTLDELTGAKKFIIWFTGFMLSFGLLVTTWLGIKK